MSVLRNTLWGRDCPGWQFRCGSVQVYLLRSACRDESCTASQRGKQHSEAGLELHCGPKGTVSYLCALLCQGSAGSGELGLPWLPHVSQMLLVSLVLPMLLSLSHISPFSCVLSGTPLSRFNHPAGKSVGMGWIWLCQTSVSCVSAQNCCYLDSWDLLTCCNWSG